MHFLQLEIHPNFLQHYISAEEQLARNETPTFLFKNIVARNDKEQTLRTGLSTFICKLNDKLTLQALNEIMQKTTEVIKKHLSNFNNYQCQM